MKVIRFEQRDCEKTRDLLDAWLSNELSDETRQETEQHLNRCADCREELETRSRIRRRLKEAVAGEPVPAGLAGKIRRDIRSRPVFPRWVMAAAAALLLGAGGWLAVGLLNRYRSDQTIAAQPLTVRTERVLRIGFGNHQHCVFDRGFRDRVFTAEEINEQMGDQIGLVTVAGQHLPEGFRINVAHRCSFQNRNFIHLTLKNQAGNLLSLTLTRKQNGESLPAATSAASEIALHHARLQNFEVSGFEAHDHLAFVVSDLQPEENLRIAARLAPALSNWLAGVA